MSGRDAKPETRLNRGSLRAASEDSIDGPICLAIRERVIDLRIPGINTWSLPSSKQLTERHRKAQGSVNRHDQLVGLEDFTCCLWPRATNKVNHTPVLSQLRDVEAHGVPSHWAEWPFHSARAMACLRPIQPPTSHPMPNTGRRRIGPTFSSC